MMHVALTIAALAVLPVADTQATPVDPDVRFAEKVAWRASNEPAEYRRYTQQFQLLFNAKDMDGILDTVSDEMAGQQNMENFARFLTDFREQNGSLESLSFKYFDTKGQRRDKVLTAAYLAKFSSGAWWDLRFQIKPAQRLNRFLILDNNFNDDLPLRRNSNPIGLPFAGGSIWFVLWGGDSEQQNYHVISRSQKNAYDFVIRNEFSKLSYRTDGLKNEDYYAFGQRLLSPASGEIVQIIEGVEDNVPGEMNPGSLTGNTIVIRIAEQEYLLMAHLQKDSIKVAKGDQVQPGQFIGRVGNSGNSSEPHLHLHLMDRPNLQEATGIKLYFSEVVIDGVSHARFYAPVQGDRVSVPPEPRL